MENEFNLFLTAGHMLDAMPNWVIERVRKENFAVTGFILPSGNACLIRETNGNDEDIISNTGLNQSNVATAMFLANIIVYHEQFSSDNSYISVKDLEKLPLRDKAFIMVASRIFSLGNYLTINYTFPNISGELPFTQDLFEYVWDYSKPMPIPGDNLYSKFRIEPYKFGNQNSFEFKTSSNSSFKFSILTMSSEKILLEKEESEMQINDLLTIRGMHCLIEGNWVKISNYKNFSSRELQELRNYVLSVDKPANMVVELINPVTGEGDYPPLFNMPNFFFQTEA